MTSTKDETTTRLRTHRRQTIWNVQPPTEKQVQTEELFSRFVMSRDLDIRKVVIGEPCVYCGQPSDTIEHVIPKSQAAGLKLNKTGACKKCNNARGDKPFLIWWGLRNGVLKYEVDNHNSDPRR